jgi:hypothetical protein
MRITLKEKPIAIQHPTHPEITVFIDPESIGLAWVRALGPVMDQTKAGGMAALEMLARMRSVVPTLVVGWEGIEDEDGKPIPFTPEAAPIITRHDFDFTETVLVDGAEQVQPRYFFATIAAELTKRSMDFSSGKA